jgi:hypothetical protein
MDARHHADLQHPCTPFFFFIDFTPKFKLNGASDLMAYEQGPTGPLAQAYLRQTNIYLTANTQLGLHLEWTGL